eukprot:gene1316-biopygen46
MQPLLYRTTSRPLIWGAEFSGALQLAFGVCNQRFPPPPPPTEGQLLLPKLVHPTTYPVQVLLRRVGLRGIASNVPS